MSVQSIITTLLSHPELLLEEDSISEDLYKEARKNHLSPQFIDAVATALANNNIDTSEQEDLKSMASGGKRSAAQVAFVDSVLHHPLYLAMKERATTRNSLWEPREGSQIDPEEVADEEAVLHEETTPILSTEEMIDKVIELIPQYFGKIQTSNRWSRHVDYQDYTPAHQDKTKIEYDKWTFSEDSSQSITYVDHQGSRVPNYYSVSFNISHNGQIYSCHLIYKEKEKTITSQVSTGAQKLEEAQVWALIVNALESWVF